MGFSLLLSRLQWHGKSVVTRKPGNKVRPEQDYLFIFLSDRRHGRGFLPSLERALFSPDRARSLFG
tara:strand:- start:79293 stop:79490 length:198 start_codon:yes stop_codon:yes gene_type:complete